MTKTLTAGILALALCAPLPGQVKKFVGLPDAARKWLEEEVVYIITPKERDVFLKLGSDRERDIFVEAFWKQRDPTPGTPRNEFREEHYRRIAHANRILGRGTPLPGWKTDRGRIYILLGEPKSVEQFDEVSNVVPTEIWSYLGDPARGLPPAFNVIFFKEHGSGDYVLYSPSQHGPGALVSSMVGGYRDERQAYEELKKLAPNLAYQTLSLIPGERNTPGSMSLASNQLIANIYAMPRKMVKDSYADAILKYKDSVEVEYTANYISSEVQVQVIRDEAGTAFVNYTIAPARITAQEIDGKYEIRFTLNGRVSDASGKTVYQFDKDLPFSLTADELEGMRAKSLSIQDVFPLVPGSYNFDILLKNVLSKEFTGSSKPLVVPPAGGTAGMSPLLLAYGVETKPAPAGERVPFKAGGAQLLCQTHKTFGTGDQLVLFCQLYGLTDGLRAAGALRYDFLKEDQAFLTRTAKVESTGPVASVLDVQPLRDFPPGYYQARVTLLDGQGSEVASAKDNFEVSPAKAVPRPMVVSKVTKELGNVDNLFATGLQSLNLGDVETARTRLAEANAKAPQRADVAVAYAQLLFRSKDYRRVKDVLLPWAGDEAPAPEVPALLGQACHALGEYQEAAAFYASYLTQFGANIDILNYLGTCHFQLGNTAEALKAWTKSLELNPNQDKLKALVDSLKKK